MVRVVSGDDPGHTHRGEKSVKVGEYELFPAALVDLRLKDIRHVDVLINLSMIRPRVLRAPALERINYIEYPMLDFAGVPPDWEDFLQNTALPLLKEDKRLMPFCHGGHGRTGTFIASMIALLEPDNNDPIAAARSRYCKFAVETLWQGHAIFALTQTPLPTRYLSGRDSLLR